MGDTMNTGKTKNLGIIGFPIEHSLSPVLQNAALAAADLDYTYIAMPVQSAQLCHAVDGLKALGFCGINVTIPHKTAIIPLLDSIDENARMIGAVNTVVNKNGKLVGYNTDVIGFTEGLIHHGFQAAGRNAVLLGAGGAARSVVWGLIKSGIRSISIGVRNADKARPLLESFGTHAAMQVFTWEDPSFEQELAKADLLVNTTPLGMYPKVDAAPPVPWEQLKPDAFVYDIIYTPWETKFLQLAKQHGHPVLNGTEMLVGQGAAAFKLWLGQNADVQIMTKALRNALKA